MSQPFAFTHGALRHAHSYCLKRLANAAEPAVDGGSNSDFGEVALKAIYGRV